MLTILKISKLSRNFPGVSMEYPETLIRNYQSVKILIKAHKHDKGTTGCDILNNVPVTGTVVPRSKMANLYF